MQGFSKQGARLIQQLPIRQLLRVCVVAGVRPQYAGEVCGRGVVVVWNAAAAGGRCELCLPVMVGGRCRGCGVRSREDRNRGESRREARRWHEGILGWLDAVGVTGSINASNGSGKRGMLGRSRGRICKADSLRAIRVAAVGCKFHG